YLTDASISHNYPLSLRDALPISRLKRGEGDVYVALYAVENKAGGGPNRDRTMVQLDLLELKPMEDRMVVLDADAHHHPVFHGLQDRKSTRLNSSHVKISYAVFCL